MISKELAEKYHLPPIEEYPFGERDWYETFIIQSDRDTLRAIEEQLLGTAKRGTDYTELLAARAEARAAIEAIENGKGAEK